MTTNDLINEALKVRGIAADPDQMAVINFPNKPLLVSAGPGCGKTETLLFRAIAMLNDTNVIPRDLCFITFTNRAANSLKQRLAELRHRELQSLPLNDIYIGTLHSLALDILSGFTKYSAKLGFIGNPRPLTSNDMIYAILYSLDAASELVTMLSDSAGGFVSIDNIYSEVTTMISKIEQGNKQAESTLSKQFATKWGMSARNRSKITKILKQLYSEFNQQLQNAGLITFAKMISDAVKVLKDNPLIYAGRFKFIGIDEFQDLDIQQQHFVYLLAQRLQGEFKNNVTVVGDPNQSIFGFRGANPDGMEKFKRTFKADSLLLKNNYRSTAPIKSIVSYISDQLNNSEPLMVKDIKHALFIARPQRQETIGASALAEALLAAKATRAILNYSDVVILARSVRRSKILSIYNQLDKAGIPFIVLDDRNAKDDHEVWIVMDMIRTLLYKQDLPVFKKYFDKTKKRQDFIATQKASHPQCKRTYFALNKFKREKDQGFYKRITMQETLELLKEHYPVRDALLFHAEHTALINFIRTLEQWTQVFGGDYQLEKFARRALLHIFEETSTIDIIKDPLLHDAVVISTIHKAKGLEFPVACIVLPGKQGNNGPTKSGTIADLGTTPDSEKNLFFVAVSRASDAVVIVDNKNKTAEVSCIVDDFLQQGNSHTKLGLHLIQSRPSALLQKQTVIEPSMLLHESRCLRHYAITVGSDILEQPNTYTALGEIYHVLCGDIISWLFVENEYFKLVKRNNCDALMGKLDRRITRLINQYKLLERFKILRDSSNKKVQQLPMAVKNSIRLVEQLVSKEWKIELPESHISVPLDLIVNTAPSNILLQGRPDIVLTKTNVVAVVDFKVAAPHRNTLQRKAMYRQQVQCYSQLVATTTNRRDGGGFIIYGENNKMDRVAPNAKAINAALLNTTQFITDSKLFNAGSHPVNPTLIECNSCQLKGSCKQRSKT
jgi:DNA helicase-2/ATP-dependent DNA helicase PcrA